MNRRALTLSVLALVLLSVGLIVLPLASNANAETLGAWNPTTAYPSKIAESSCVTSGGYIYCVGGNVPGSGPTTAVYYGAVTSSGVTSWALTSAYPLNIYWPSCAISGGYIYCVGGATDGSDSQTDAVYYAAVSSSGVSTWTSTTSYPVYVDAQSCAISGGYIYCVGGFTFDPFSGASDTAKVYYGAVTSSGVTSWTSTTAYPETIDGESCAISGGYIYCVGGYAADSAYSNGVAYGHVTSSGVTSWGFTTAYPVSPANEACAVSSGYMYCVGGGLESGPFWTAEVAYGLLTSSGVPSWTSTTAYPFITDGTSCAFSSGIIYCVGGGDGTVTNAVYYSQVGSASTTSSSSSTSTTSSSSSTTSTTSSSSSVVPVCPSTFGGVLMPPGATFAYGGHTWVAPAGSDGLGLIWSSYFFQGPASSVPPPMLMGWAGVYGTYSGQQGWIITFFC